jgi:hypothetical protein
MTRSKDGQSRVMSGSAWAAESGPSDPVATPDNREDVQGAEAPPPPPEQAGTGSPAPLSELFDLSPDAASEDQLQDIVQRHFAWELSHSPLSHTHNVLFLYDTGSIERRDANRVYRALGSCDTSRPTLLILQSGGGDIAAAYFIAKLCRESSSVAFEAAVPRQAKSAATLICCGADAVHMGSLSELGPIDPQFGHIPALALKHSVEHIAELASSNPGASEMLSSYLSKSLRVEALGFYERVAESAVQYAERLLGSRKSVERTAQQNSDLARRLVYAYKDHGFVIDAQEAADVFGSDVIRVNTVEYDAANQLYGALDFLGFILRRSFKKNFLYTGGVADGCLVYSHA